ncbi:XRE family transcriptional regulator [Streptomyces longwoodensis]|uniref:XRE family transcriptional regulator n=1 Tax=Streptomyces longwoodensis TaxID=68231 RepID=UPI0033ACAD3F
MHLAQLLASAMRRHHLSVEALALATGIRTPRIKAFLEDGTDGPVHPTVQELRKLADTLALPAESVTQGAQRTVAAAGQRN